MRFYLVLFVVKVCHVGIATGEDVHKPLTGHNVTYSPATVNPVTHGHVTSSPHVKDHSGLEFPEKVEEMQEPALEALKHYIESRKDQPQVNAKMLMKITDLRSISVKDTNHSTHGNNHSETGCKDSHSDGLHGEEGHGHKSKRIHVVEFNFDHVKTPFLFGLVVIIAGLSKIVFHHANFLSSKVPESCILIILGVIFGAIFLLAGTGDDLEQFFQPDQFFLYLLPPIILEAAFSLHDRTFTDNLGSIIMFSVVGTVIACFAIGMSLVGLAKVGAMEDPQATPVQILVFSALIVAVDPVAVLAIFQEVGVNNMLYFLVFGESLLNDGVTVVLYNVMQIYSRMDTIEADQIILGIVKFLVVVFGGIIIGVATGLLSSLLTRCTNNVKVVEPIIIFGFAYQSYIIAEMFHFSGIISIIGCGLTQMQYAFNNITNKSKLACKFFAKVIRDKFKSVSVNL